MDVKAARRTLAVFEIFAQKRQPLSVTELVKELECPMSTGLYLIRTLERLGYLYTVGGKRSFYPTRKLSEIASAIAASEPWIDRIEPLLEKLRDDSRETVILGRQQGTRVVYLAVYEGPGTIRYVARAGDIKPLHSSAIGKALLATVEPAKLPPLLRKIELKPITASTILSPELLAADIERTQARGYAVSLGENVDDVTAIARTLRINDGFYAVAIAGPGARMGQQLDEQLARLEAACAAIGRV